MNEGEKRCECAACGETAGLFGVWPSCKRDMGDDLVGAKMCKSCYLNEEWETLASRIRARRSAQPAVASEAVALDRLGREIRVGDWYDSDYESGQILEIRFDMVDSRKEHAWLETTRTRTSGGCPYTIWSDQAERIAAPPGGEKAKDVIETSPPEPDACSKHFVDVHDESCSGCGLTTEMLERHGLVPRALALGEVEIQLSLVARLDFDLRMLKLLGQGWSRGDLAAHMSRAAEKTRGGGR